MFGYRKSEVDVTGMSGVSVAGNVCSAVPNLTSVAACGNVPAMGSDPTLNEEPGRTIFASELTSISSRSGKDECAGSYVLKHSPSGR